MERRGLSGRFAFGDACAGDDENERFVPGLGWLTLPAV